MTYMSNLIKDILYKVNNLLYLIIPTLCIGAYALFYLIRINFIPNLVDFSAFYSAAEQIIINPTRLYEISKYYYMPAFASFFVILLFFNITYAYFIFYLLNYVLAILGVLEFNKILIFKGIKNKNHRLIFLMIISNGWMIYYQFYLNQTKFLVLFIFLFIIRRELQFKEYGIKKDLKFYIINYMLFVFALSVVPFMIFLLAIYLFYDMPFKNLLKKEFFKKFSIIIISFFIQNIFFFIFPHLFIDFLIRGINFESYSPYENTLQIFYLREFLIVVPTVNFYVRILTLLILGFFTLFLIYKQNLLIDEKFSIFCLVFLLVDTFNSLGIFIVLIPFCCLLFVKYLHQEENFTNFIKKNKILLIGLISLSFIAFMIRTESIFNFFPILKNYPLVILVNLRWIFLLVIFGSSLIILFFQERKRINNSNLPKII